MKRILLALPLVALTAACQTTQQSNNTAAAVGTGAAIGALVNDDNRLGGAAAGAAVAGLATILIDRANQPGQCRYLNQRTGETYTAPCPG